METNNTLQEQILDATVKHIRALVAEHAPSGTSRDFLQWILADQNPHRADYLQVTGASKVSQLSAFLVSDILDATSANYISDYLGALNAYFFFEIVSDNLAIGLACEQKGNRKWQLQKDILSHFNSSIQEKLNGNKFASADLLSPISDKINLISLFDQSLVPGEIQKFAALYQDKNLSAEKELEHSTFTYLILNIESSMHIIDSINSCASKPLLISSLKDRYAAGNALLNLDFNTSIDSLIDFGTQTILIIPVMLYISSAINSVRPSENWNIIIKNGLLYKAAKTAACLIRIVNDLGTKLLESTEFAKLEQALSGSQPKASFLTSLASLYNTEQFSSCLTRIRKDVKHCEFNVCLDNVRKITNSEEACKLFLNNIDRCSALYKSEREKLLIYLDEISESLQDDHISLPIFRMVTFHEEMYEQDFEHNLGDFATRS